MEWVSTFKATAIIITYVTSSEEMLKNYAFMHDVIKHVHFLLTLYGCKTASGPRK